AHQLVERNLIDGAMPLGKVHRRVDVRAAVLGAGKIVRGVVVALLGDAVGNVLQLETFGGWPEQRLVAVVVREVDERAGWPRRGRRSARTLGGDERKDNDGDGPTNHGAPISA